MIRRRLARRPTRITADLLDQPNGNALMTYFQSVRVQVLDVEEDWVKVRVGDADSGSLTGYMATDALTYTEDGIRTLLGQNHCVCVKGRGQGDEGMR